MTTTIYEIRDALNNNDAVECAFAGGQPFRVTAVDLGTREAYSPGQGHSGTWVAASELQIVRSIPRPEAASASYVASANHDNAVRFDSARDAIDAVSAFEQSVITNWEYDIRAVDESDDGGFAYEVHVHQLDAGVLFRGFLAVNA